jgi:hypothetical protein
MLAKVVENTDRRQFIARFEHGQHHIIPHGNQGVSASAPLPARLGRLKLLLDNSTG